MLEESKTLCTWFGGTIKASSHFVQLLTHLRLHSALHIISPLFRLAINMAELRDMTICPGEARLALPHQPISKTQPLDTVRPWHQIIVHNTTTCRGRLNVANQGLCS